MKGEVNGPLLWSPIEGPHHWRVKNSSMINIIPSFVLQVAYTEAIFLLNQNASNRNVKITANHAWDLTVHSLSSFPPINLQFSRTLSEILTHTLSSNCFDLPGTPRGSWFSLFMFQSIKTLPRPTQKATGEFFSHLWGATWELSKLHPGLLWRANLLWEAHMLSPYFLPFLSLIHCQ